jgi:hypothetical protein
LTHDPFVLVPFKLLARCYRHIDNARMTVMANEPTRTTGGNEPRRPQPPTTSGSDMSEQDQRDMQQSQGQSQRSGEAEDHDDTDRVEIGDPVPEDQRTIKAGRGTGETGEDEDLPDDDAGIETPSERH